MRALLLLGLFLLNVGAVASSECANRVSVLRAQTLLIESQPDADLYYLKVYFEQPVRNRDGFLRLPDPRFPGRNRSIEVLATPERGYDVPTSYLLVEHDDTPEGVPDFEYTAEAFAEFLSGKTAPLELEAVPSFQTLRVHSMRRNPDEHNGPILVQTMERAVQPASGTVRFAIPTRDSQLHFFKQRITYQFDAERVSATPAADGDHQWLPPSSFYEISPLNPGRDVDDWTLRKLSPGIPLFIRPASHPTSWPKLRALGGIFRKREHSSLADPFPE